MYSEGRLGGNRGDSDLPSFSATPRHSHRCRHVCGEEGRETARNFCKRGSEKEDWGGGAGKRGVSLLICSALHSVQYRPNRRRSLPVFESK